MGDVVGLVEQVQQSVDREEMERVADQAEAGQRISLEDYREQLRQLVNIGGHRQLLDKLPGVKPEQLAAAWPSSIRSSFGGRSGSSTR